MPGESLERVCLDCIVSTVCYAADVVLPMTGPPVPAGAVVVDGDTIVAVGEAARLRGDADRVHEVEGVLLPGLVNGHTCVEHADARQLARPGPFHVWHRAVTGLTRTWDDERWSRSARRGVAQLLHHGSTAAGDVVHHGPGVPATARAGVVGTSWVDVRMVDHTEVDDVLPALAHALSLPAEGRSVGIAPHSCTTLGTGVLQGLARLAAERHVPLHVEAAASNAEVVAIRQGSGPLADAAREAGMQFEWLEGGTGMGPVRYLDECGVLQPGTTLTHMVWVELADARLLTERHVTAVLCPRASERLQGGDAPLERYADAGTRLALGTDSAAAVPDADLLAEAAAWVRLARARGLALWPSPVGPVPLEEQALRLVTVDGAKVLGWGDRAGLLEPGRRADLCGIALDTTARTVYRDLVERGPGRQVLTVLGGVRKARRSSADVAWPEHDDVWRDAS